MIEFNAAKTGKATIGVFGKMSSSEICFNCVCIVLKKERKKERKRARKKERN